MDKNCQECHDAQTKEGGLDLTILPASPQNPVAFAAWMKVHDRVHKGEMPPRKAHQPSAADKSAFEAAISQALIAEDRRREREAGRTVLRRLNREEYENTLRALLAASVSVKDILPPDTPLHGFDTVSEGLRFSQLQIEKYLEAADAALDAAIVLSEPPKHIQKRLSLKDEKSVRENLDTPEGKVTDPVAKNKHHIMFRELPDAVVLFSTGYSPTDLKQFSAPATGDYRIRVSAYAWKSRGERATLRVYAHRYREKRLVGLFEMPPDTPREATFTAHLERDELLQIVPYGTGYDEKGQDVWKVSGPQFDGIGLAVQWIDIEGPLGDWPPPSTRAVFAGVPLKELPEKDRRWRDGQRIAYSLAPDDARAAARKIVEQFAQRAFRRPLEPREAEPFVKLALAALDEGRPLEAAVRPALRAVLTAPQFLLLDERPGKLTPHALASRLSYFLWSGPPDEPLLTAAADGSLLRGDVLREQTERMLRDERSREFVRNFTGQWLDLRKINATSPDKSLYPEFDEILQRSMVGETENFFREVLDKNLPVSSFIQSDFLVLDRTLARFYGVPGVETEAFQRVALPADSPRGGVLTQSAVLKVTANGTVTSPVLRGAWVMKRLLANPPPAPPPNVGSVEPDTRGATTIREQLARHRAVESCGRCHRDIDPPGFALESFDVIGGWRDRYRSIGKGDKPPGKRDGRDIWEYKLGPAVDASGEMPDGRAFHDIREFKKLLLADPNQVLRCVTENLLVYSTGAGIRFCDRGEVERLVAQTNKSGGGLRTLVHQIVQSPVFQSK